MSTLDQGIIVSCALCDSYQIIIIGGFQPAAWRGRAGTKALDERNHRVQLQWERRRWALLRCSCCVECVSGLKFQEWHEVAMRCSRPH